MKNSTHYRLRALACALLASAAMLGACDDDDPNDDPDPGKKPPVTLTDQIQYDGGDLVGIKSAIYVAEEDGSHTFYLSPTEGLINAEQMKQADDYLRVMVESPKGTVNTASDPFEIEYKDISVKKTTMNDVASVERRSGDGNPAQSLYLCRIEERQDADRPLPEYLYGRA